MSAFKPHHPGQIALVLGLALALAACDEPQPNPMAVIQAASGPEGDALQTRAAFAEAAWREHLQLMYFGEQGEGEQKALAGGEPNN